MNSSVEIVLFKADTDKEQDDYLELFKSSQFKAYSVSPIRFEFKNMNVLATKLKETNFCSNYSSLVITSPRVIEILEHLIQNQKLNIDSLRRIPCLTVGPQTQKKLFKVFQINSLVDNERSNVNNAEELANYLIQHQNEIIKQIDSTKPLFYPTSDLSKEEFATHLCGSAFKVEKFICYETLPNERLDCELQTIVDSLINENQEVSEFNNDEQKQKLNEIVEKSFLFVFFSPSGVMSVKEMVKCIRLEKMKLIAIGPTTKRSIEENKLNLVSTSAKPTPEALLETVSSYLKAEFVPNDKNK